MFQQVSADLNLAETCKDEKGCFSKLATLLKPARNLFVKIQVSVN